MPRGSSDEGKLTMLHKERNSSNGLKKSYITNRHSRTKDIEKIERKTSVTESLAKFLEDCEDEDLLMTASARPRKPKKSALSMSEHGPRGEADPLFSPSNKPKRKGTKKDRREQFSKSSSDLLSPSGLSVSEHGTPSTKKSSLDSSTMKASPLDSIVVQSIPKLDEPPVDECELNFANFGDSTSKRRSTKKRSSSSNPRQRMSRSQSERGSRGSSTRERSASRTRSRSRRAGDRTRSGTRDRPLRSTRRTKSDDAMSLSAHLSRTPSMRRSSHRGGDGTASLGAHLVSRTPSTRRNSLMGEGDDDNRSVASGRSTYSTMSHRTGRSVSLDAGPLNAFLNADPRPNRQSSSMSVGPGIQGDGGSRSSSSDAFMKLRKSRQDEILQLAHEERWKSKGQEEEDDDVQNDVGDEDSDSGDDDQPKEKGKKKKKGALAKFKKGIKKTKKVTKSTAKGTVNVVRDPKKAAKKVGVFAKDVGKGTVQMALDPKLAAKTAANLGKDITKGTYKVTKGVGKGVAKGSLGLTKTVAKTGVKTTTLVVGAALNGAGQLVDGATGLIFKNGDDNDEEKYAEYHASELESRRKGDVSLLDRVTDVFDAEKEEEKVAPGSPKKKKHNKRTTSMVAPTISLGNKNQSWDF